MSYVMCDGCGDPADLGDNAEEARANAAREGYRRFERLDLCPRCFAKEMLAAPDAGGER